MSDPIKILLVADSQEDVDLVSNHLLAARLDFTCVRVENRAALQAALVEGEWAAIIAACELADFDALSALEILKKSGRDIPFIVIADTSSADSAVALMKSGAQDFVMKPWLARLAPVIEREQAEARRRRSQLQGEERYRMIFEQASDGIFISDLSGRYIDVNPSGCEMLGYTRAELTNLSMKDLVAPSDAALTPLRIDELRSGKSLMTERSLVRKDGSQVLVEISGKMLADGCLQGIVRDITARNRAEQQILRMNRIYAVISQINQSMVRTRQAVDLLESVCRITVQQGNFRMAWFGLVDPQTGAVQPGAVAGVDEGYLAIIPPISIRNEPEGRGPTGSAIRAGEVYFCNDIANDPIMQPWREQALRRGYRSSIALPVVKYGQVIGALTIYAAEPFFFNPSEIRLLQQVTSDIGFALEKIESEQERERAEAALRESEERFSTIFQSSPDCISIASLPERRIIDVNPAYCSTFGRIREQLIGRLIPDLNLWLYDNERDGMLEQTLANRHLDDFEARYLTPAGTVGAMLVSARIISLGGQPCLLVIGHDISQRKQAEDTLRRNQVFLSDLIENSGAAIFAKDIDGPYTLVNRQWELQTGIQKQFAIGKTDLDLFPAEFAEIFRKNDLRVIETGSVLQTDELIEDANGKRCTMTTKFPLRDENNVIIGVCGISTDITERREAAEQLREANARLEQRVQERTADLKVANVALQKAARMKDEFLASMSHELRTPLTGILGLSESLMLNTYGGLNDDQQNALRMLDKSGHHLLDLINEILDLSKIEAGKLELQLASCSLDSICQASLQMVSSLARQKDLQTNFSMHPISMTVRADARRLKQMVVNLLSNAVKFTPEHGSIGVDVVGSPAAHQVSITVWDTGIGIHPEDLPRLFQPFVQLDSSLARQFPGTGLGLAMVLRLAELHGGSVYVESVPAQGSRFSILLPWDTIDPESQTPRRRVTDRLTLLPATETSLPPGPLVLAVDDNPIMLEVFGDYLSAQNFGFIATYSGEEFLERLESSHPGILLVDIQMPGMDGLEIIRRVRSHPEAYFASLPVVAVTALAMSGDRERCLEAGANAYLSKPVALAELASVLRGLVGQNLSAPDFQDGQDKNEWL